MFNPQSIHIFEDFKIGDKVKIITSYQDCYFWHGETAKIVKLIDGNEINNTIGLGIIIKLDKRRRPENCVQKEFNFNPADLILINNPKLRKYYIAIGFDGCIVTNRFPKIGCPKTDIIKVLEEKVKMLQEECYFDVKIILLTRRIGDQLEEALICCKEQGIEIEDFKTMHANEYWSNRSVIVDGNEVIGAFNKICKNDKPKIYE